MTNKASAYLHGTGIDATLHQLRHYFGTSLYRTTSDIRLVQEMLGHTDPKTTAIYAAFSPSRAADAVCSLTLA